MARRPSRWVPERGEIVFIEHSPHVGKEMHPMLVCSTAAFAGKTGVVIGFPLTHASFNADNPFALAVKGAEERGRLCACVPAEVFRLARTQRTSSPLGNRARQGARRCPQEAGHHLQCLQSLNGESTRGFLSASGRPKSKPIDTQKDTCP